MKILIAGLGAIGQRHLRNMRTLMGADVEVLAYRVRGNPEALTDTLKIEEGSNLESKYNLKVFHDLDQAFGFKTGGCVCVQSQQHAHPHSAKGCPSRLSPFYRKTTFA